MRASSQEAFDVLSEGLCNVANASRELVKRHLALTQRVAELERQLAQLLAREVE